MENDIFRKKSLDRMSSPEDLSEYIRVASPGVWLVLCAIVVLLIGTVVWSVCGHLDTTVNGICVTDSTGSVCYVTEEEASSIQEGDSASIGDNECTVKSVEDEPVEAGTVMDHYALHAGGFDEDTWVYIVELDGTVDDQGVAEVHFVVESVSPMSLITN